MAVPFRRTSKTKKRMRRTHLKKDAPVVVKCPNCSNPIKPHRVCVKCGYYKGQEIIKTGEETKEKKVKEPKKLKVEKKDPKTKKVEKEVKNVE